MRSKLIYFIRRVSWFLSEIEAIFVEPDGPFPLRKLYFKLYKVDHGNVIRVGRQLHIARPQNLVVGERASIGHNTFIGNYGPITIGDDFLGAEGLTVNAGTHDPATLEPAAKPVRIGNRVWCGSNVTIVAGVEIGDDVVVGAGSVVVTDIPSNSIVVGVPARVIKPLNRDSGRSLWTWAN